MATKSTKGHKKRTAGCVEDFACGQAKYATRVLLCRLGPTVRVRLWRPIITVVSMPNTLGRAAVGLVRLVRAALHTSLAVFGVAPPECRGVVPTEPLLTRAASPETTWHASPLACSQPNLSSLAKRAPRKRRRMTEKWGQKNQEQNRLSQSRKGRTGRRRVQPLICTDPH